MSTMLPIGLIFIERFVHEYSQSKPYRSFKLKYSIRAIVRATAKLLRKSPLIAGFPAYSASNLVNFRYGNNRHMNLQYICDNDVIPRKTITLTFYNDLKMKFQPNSL